MAEARFVPESREDTVSTSHIRHDVASKLHTDAYQLAGSCGGAKISGNDKLNSSSAGIPKCIDLLPGLTIVEPKLEHLRR